MKRLTQVAASTASAMGVCPSLNSMNLPMVPGLVRTAATQAYRLLHAGMAQAVADELIAANPCAIKGAVQRDAHDRTDRRTISLEEMWARSAPPSSSRPRRPPSIQSSPSATPGSTDGAASSMR